MARYSISDGTSLNPTVSSMIAISPIKTRLTRLKPRCRPGGVCPNLVKTTDSSDIAEVHPDEKGTTNHITVGYKTPKAAVLAVVPIVAHDKVTLGWNGTGHAARTVDASIPICMLHCGMNLRSLSLDEDGPVLHVAERLQELLVGLDPPGVEIPLDFTHRNR